MTICWLSMQKKTKIQSQAVSQSPQQFADLQVHAQELCKRACKDSAMWLSLDKYQAVVIEELDQLNSSKYKPKLDKEGFQAQYESIRTFVEQGKVKRENMLKDDSMILGDIELLGKILHLDITPV